MHGGEGVRRLVFAAVNPRGALPVLRGGLFESGHGAVFLQVHLRRVDPGRDVGLEAGLVPPEEPEDRQARGLARLDEAAYGAQRQEAELAVAMVDIDHFKRVNDAYGHPVGDQVLKEVARRLMHAIRKSDVPVRYGGGEFLIILPQTRASEIPRTGERLRQAVGAESVLADGGRLAVPVSISIGIALFRRDEAGEGSETLLARADQALYQAKAEGRDRVVIAPR